MKQFKLTLTALLTFFIFDSCSNQVKPTYVVETPSIEVIQENRIENKTDNPYFESVARVCLEELGLTGIKLTIEPIDDETIREYENKGESLDAHLRDYGSYYTLFINKNLRYSIEETISHELVHLSQYNSGRLSYNDGYLTWLGQSYGVEEVDYYERPWEEEAFDSEKVMAKKIKRALK